MRRRHLLSILAICAIGILVAPSVRADVRLPSIFSDHMVIQQKENGGVEHIIDELENLSASIRIFSQAAAIAPL